jgi:hypothetical protein
MQQPRSTFARRHGLLVFLLMGLCHELAESLKIDFNSYQRHCNNGKVPTTRSMAWTRESGVQLAHMDQYHHRSHDHFRTSFPRSNTVLYYKSDENNNDWDLDSISDAEALLACRAYLQRHNRLGQWTSYQRRKQQQLSRFFPTTAAAVDVDCTHQFATQHTNTKVLSTDKAMTTTSSSLSSLSSSLSSSSSSSSSSTETSTRKPRVFSRAVSLKSYDTSDPTFGMFWDNVNELKYFKHRSRTPLAGDAIINTTTNNNNNNIDDTTTLNDENEDNDSIGDMVDMVSMKADETSRVMKYDEQRGCMLFENDNNVDESCRGSFRRSVAAKRRFADPLQKEKWYLRRWGNNTGKIISATANSSSSCGYYDVSHSKADVTTKSKFRSTHRRRSPEQQRDRRLEIRIRAIQPNQLLQGSALAELTEVEIAHAIRTYVESNRRRVTSRKRSLDNRRELFDWRARINSTVTDNMTTGTSIMSASEKGACNNTMPHESFTTFDPIYMMERRKKRSDIASKAYQNRFLSSEQTAINLHQSPSTRPMKQATIKPNTVDHERYYQRIRVSTCNNTSSLLVSSGNADRDTRQHVSYGTTPTVILHRIASDLDDGRMPHISDVEKILTYPRLSGRKDMLRRILKECFGLYGKCVPADHKDFHGSLSVDAMELKNSVLSPCIFVTNCSIEHLGSFVKFRLNEYYKQQDI